jgi:hypothetical protein
VTRRQAPLAERERNALSRIVGELRRTLEVELRRSLEGTYGIRATGEPEDESRLTLTPEQAGSRQELIGLWQALGRRTDLLVREAAFTHTNRLIAIRVAEAIGLLPESIAQGRRSSGFRQLLEVAPLLGSDDDAGYWAYLQICGDELAHDIPRLFDPRNPLLALRPPPAAVDPLVALLSDDTLGEAHDGGSAWAAPDTLGWTYQFFNSDDERSKMRRENPQPQDSRELAVRNQFFTPDYVVRFLTQNSLGRRLVEGGITELAPELELLVNPSANAAAELDLAGVRVLDPACGSGHFLLGAYDLLERAWEIRGVSPGEAAPTIVGSLWGVDIDARAAQVAAAAVTFRARRHRPDGALPAPNIVCARSVPGGDAGRAELLASVDASRRGFLAEVIDQLDRAPELGSLLKVEMVLTGETARRATYGGGRATAASGRKRDAAQTSLIDHGIETGAVDVEVIVHAALDAAQAAADSVTSTPEERVLAADGGDALRLVEVLKQRYDTVLMNPPFGEPIPDTKPYLKAAYPWIPTRDYNLLAAFVGRGLELCKPDGYVGAITSRAGMFLKTSERWRKEVLLGNDLIVLADLGHKVMHEALVEAAAYVIRPGTARHDRPATFIRLLREPSPRRPVALADACRHARAGTPDDRVFSVAPADFDAVPGSPMAYWISPDIRRLFTDYPPLEGHGAEVRVGLQTGDDFRFVRAFWEVDPARIARSRTETFHHKRWVPFAKGGEYSPFWSDIHLVVDFERDGERLRQFPGSVIRNPQYYFRPGLTWPPRTNSGFGVRVLPAGAAFGHKGPAIFADPADLLGILGWLRTRFVEGLIELSVSTADQTSSGGQSRSYEVGLVQKLPWPGQPTSGALVRQLVEMVATVDLVEETSRRFLGAQLAAASFKDAAVRHSGQLQAELEVLNISAAIEDDATRALQLGDEALRFFDDEVGPHVASYEPRCDLDDEIARLYCQPMDKTIRELIAHAGGSRAVANLTYTVDRRLEVIAHGLQVAPSSIVEVVKRRSLIPPGERVSWAASIASYLVGCAFGRWDVRIGRDPSLATPLDDDPFAPVPVCAPGMLVGPDGLPVADAPSGYPIPLTDHRVVVDEAGHPADLLVLVEAAAAALVDDPAALLDETCELLGVQDLRSYLRRRFFKDHLSRYSKSRRKAPLYWPLTVPSRSWTVWLYAPALSREAIYVAAAHAERRHHACEAEIRRLESAQLQASTPGASLDPAGARAITKRLDVERALSEELRALHRVLARVASTGWTPDLDDGIVVCAAPFADVLLDWPRDPAAARKQLRAGELGWATAHRWREAL